MILRNSNQLALSYLPIKAYFIAVTTVFCYKNETGFSSINIKVESFICSKIITQCCQTQQKRGIKYRRSPPVPLRRSPPVPLRRSPPVPQYPLRRSLPLRRSPPVPLRIHWSMARLSKPNPVATQDIFPCTSGMVFIKIISCLKCSRGSSLKIIWMNDSRKRFIDKKILLTQLIFPSNHFKHRISLIHRKIDDWLQLNISGKIFELKFHFQNLMA